MSYSCGFAKLLSTFKHGSKAQLYETAYSESKHSAMSLTLCGFDSFMK